MFAFMVKVSLRFGAGEREVQGSGAHLVPSQGLARADALSRIDVG